MFRIIARFGPFALHSWGLMLALGFLAGILIACYRAKKRGLEAQRMVDLAVVTIVAGVVGGRLAFVVTHLSDFKEFPLEVFAVWRGGLTFYGGAILAFIAGVIYLKRKSLKVWEAADVIAPSLSFGIFLGRIGCLLNGCCFGKPTLVPWAIVFPEGSYADQVFEAGTHLHPTQIYSSLAGITMFFLLLWMERWWRFNGSLFWRFVILYSVWRISVDLFRYYEPSSIYEIGALRMTESQLTSIGLIIAGIAMLSILSRKRFRTTPAKAP
ncbi:MAG: prolipoprotein diacylglyceryl transferase [bacterium]